MGPFVTYGMSERDLKHTRVKGAAACWASYKGRFL